MDARISKELEKILEDTTKLSFPMFADRDRKKKLLDAARQEIEEKVQSMLCPDDSNRLQSKMADLWEAAEKSASEQFCTLPEKLKINSFYFQEVMHTYMESIIVLLSKEEVV